MKIALFSDIHANLPALQAVLKDIENRNTDAIYCLGDLVGYATWPNEVIHEIRKRNIPTIAGNYDQGIGLNSDECGCAYKTDFEKGLGKISIAYTNEQVGAMEREYLRTLPSHIRLEFKLQNTEIFTVLLVHGSPRKINEYLFEDRDEKSLHRIMEQANADIMAFGHTHKPFHKALNGHDESTKNHYRHAVNIGSVGKPKDGDTRACYVLVTLDENTTINDPNSVKIEFIRVAYDINLAATEIEKSKLPNEYADMLRKAY